MIEPNPGFLVPLAGAVLLMIGISWWVAMRTRDGEDFLLAGRKLRTPLVMGTTLATLVGTGSSLGAVGYAYESGWAGALYGIGGAVGVFALLWLFADVRDKGFMTFAEEMSYYYGANRVVKGLVAVLLFLASVGWLGAHIMGGAIYLSYLTGMGDDTAKIVIALGFGIYTIIGGYLAVVVTDAIQGTLLFLGFTLLAVLALVKVGGPAGLSEGTSAEAAGALGLDALGPLPAVSLALVIAVGVVAGPSYRQRIYAAADVRTVRRSFLLAGLLFAAFSALPAVAGIAASRLAPDLPSPDMAFPYLATELFPAFVGAFLLIAGLSATMSSGDSDAIVGVSILIRDVAQLVTGRVPRADRVVLYSRLGLGAVLGLALVFALAAETIIEYITTMIATILTGLLVASLLGKFWRRATWPGGIAAMVCGSAAALVVNSSGPLTEFWGNAVIPSLAAALVAGVVVSLVTPRNRVSSEEALRVLREERAHLETADALRAREG
ncbi:sodium:solute symporter family protein [Georgenia alba]|uniref:Sodium:solute symporter family protein n=1 Tax=Georgenia alba TaxID=2233858 RepID=A0ABW2QA09_9MICO